MRGYDKDLTVKQDTTGDAPSAEVAVANVPPFLAATLKRKMRNPHLVYIHSVDRPLAGRSLRLHTK